MAQGCPPGSVEFSSSLFYDALAQGVLNTISHWEATAETATAVPVAGGQSENGAGKTKSTTCAASGGITGGGSKYLGIGYSPVLGLVVFIVIVVMLMSTDSYAGAARLALHLHDGYELKYSKMYNVAYARLKTKVQRRPTLW